MDIDLILELAACSSLMFVWALWIRLLRIISRSGGLGNRSKLSPIYVDRFRREYIAKGEPAFRSQINNDQF